MDDFLRLAVCFECSRTRRWTFEGDFTGTGLRRSQEIVHRAVCDRGSQEIHIGQLTDRHIPREVDGLLVVLHRAAVRYRVPNTVTTCPCVYSADRLVYAGIGRRVVLQMYASGYVPLQAIVSFPRELFEISGFHNHQCRAFVPQQCLFVVAINLGIERYVFGLVVHVEVLDEFGILVIDVLLSLYQATKRDLRGGRSIDLRSRKRRTKNEEWLLPEFSILNF